MTLQFNQQLFGKKEELDGLKAKKVENVSAIEKLKQENIEIDQKVPVFEREIAQLVARVKQDMTNRVARINAACFRNDPFKYRASLHDDMSILIEKEVSGGVFASVWMLCQTESGEFGIDPESNNLPGNPAEQLHLFGKFAQIIANLK